MYYRPNPVLVLDHDVANIDLRATFSMSNASGRAGLVARTTGYADYYAASLGPWNVFRVVRCDHHDEKLLGKRQVPVLSDHRYRIRLLVTGTGPVRVRAKVWPSGTGEPAWWMVDRIDDSPKAIVDQGSFGVIVEHGIDGRGLSARVRDVVAWSKERGSITAPEITYALAGAPSPGSVKVVAKASIPSYIGFEYGPEPTLTQEVRKVWAKQASARAHTATGRLEIGDFPAGTPVYWRAFAEHRGRRTLGPISSFRTSPPAGVPVRFAFGSCTKWRASPRTSFRHARLKLPDFYLHQGDLGYVPHRVIDHAPDTYQDHWTRMLADTHLQEMTREVPFIFYRDDAEYGVNMADSRTLRPFTIRAHNELHANPTGSYFSFRYGDVAVFSLDCRRFSTGRKPPLRKRSKLGADQKRWLLDGMKAAAKEGVGLIVVASPQAFGSDATPASWRMHYTEEWSELMTFFEGVGAPVLIVSGDAHGHRLHEYPQKNLEPGVPRIVEFVSAGTEQNKFPDALDPQFVVRRAKGSGFGFVELGAEQEIGGQHVRTLSLAATRSSDGSEFWRAQYLVVRGVGILPVG